MKQKITLMMIAMLSLFGLQNVEAQVAYDIFSLETIADGNATVGSFEKSGVNSTDSETNRWTMKSTGAYIKCTTSQAIQEGDELIITGETKSTSTNGFCVRMEGTKDVEPVAELKGNGKKKAQTTKYTVEAGSKLIGQSTFYVMMANKDRQWWIDKIEMTSSKNPSLTISEAMGYCTYSNPSCAIDFTNSGAKAYIITSYNSENQQLTFKEVNKVPANTGVLVMGTPNTTISLAIAEGETDDVAGNLLVADNGSIKTGSNDYILTIKDNVAGFYKSVEGRALTPGKAHLQIPNTANAAVFYSIGFGNGETTGITGTNIEKGRNVNVLTYNLAGQVVDKSFKGMVIKNGKKYLQR